MSQRDSGYERKDRDLYETPAWVTDALIPHLPKWVNPIWEPAAGGGKMVDALIKAGFAVYSTDIATGCDFLLEDMHEVDAIVTNPPYAIATEFIEHALGLTKARRGAVAMLLRTDFDHAKTRAHLFHGCKAFSKKIVLTRRIVWFDGPNAAPSFNHAWYIWDWQHSGSPILAYGPQTEVA